MQITITTHPFKSGPKGKEFTDEAHLTHRLERMFLDKRRVSVNIVNQRFVGKVVGSSPKPARDLGEYEYTFVVELERAKP